MSWSEDCFVYTGALAAWTCADANQLCTQGRVVTASRLLKFGFSSKIRPAVFDLKKMKSFVFAAVAATAAAQSQMLCE
jgi:hypothetical protein